MKKSPMPLHPPAQRSLTVSARRFTSGATLVEAVVATGVIAIFMSGIYAVHGRALAKLSATRERALAEHALRARVEKLRSATWENATNAAYLRDTVLTASAANTFPPLAGLVLSVRVTPYPTGSATPVAVTRQGNGVAVIEQAGNGAMKDEKSARFELAATWGSRDGFRKTAETFTVLSEHGIAGRKQ